MEKSGKRQNGYLTGATYSNLSFFPYLSLCVCLPLLLPFFLSPSSSSHLPSTNPLSGFLALYLFSVSLSLLLSSVLGLCASLSVSLSASSSSCPSSSLSLSSFVCLSFLFSSLSSFSLCLCFFFWPPAGFLCFYSVSAAPQLCLATAQISGFLS